MVADDKGLEKLGIFKGNNYFQASEQVIYLQVNVTPPAASEQGQKNHSKIPDDYVVSPRIGAHKFHLPDKNWNDARNICIREGGKFVFM